MANNTSFPENQDGELCTGPDYDHVLYQLASLGLVVAFLMPCTYSWHDSLRRGLSVCASLFFLLWSIGPTTAVDLCAWHTAFMIVNIGYLLCAAIQTWPTRKLDVKLRRVYVELFQPLHMPLNTFLGLSEIGEVEEWTEHQVLFNGDSPGKEKLYLLLSGSVSAQYQGMSLHSLSAQYQGMSLHSVSPGQFINSVEYESNTPVLNQQVAYHTELPCQVLVWSRGDIDAILSVKPDLRQLFYNVIGHDIYQKVVHTQMSKCTQTKYTSFLRATKAKYTHYGILRNSL